MGTPATPATTTVSPVAEPQNGDVATTGQQPTTAVAEPKAPLSFDQLDPQTQEHVRALRKENETLRKEKQTREDAERTAQTEKLKEQQRWEQLANERESELAELRPYKTQVEELNTMLMKHFNTEIEKWPEEVKNTAPKGEVSATVMGEWIESHRPLAQKLMQTAETPAAPVPKPGNPSGPTPTKLTTRPASPSEAEPLTRVSL